MVAVQLISKQYVKLMMQIDEGPFQPAPATQAKMGYTWKDNVVGHRIPNLIYESNEVGRFET